MARRKDRNPARHGLQDRQAKALVDRRVRKGACAGIEVGQISLGYETKQVKPAGPLPPPQLGQDFPVKPTRGADEDEWKAAA